MQVAALLRRCRAGEAAAAEQAAAAEELRARLAGARLPSQSLHAAPPSVLLNKDMMVLMSKNSLQHALCRGWQAALYPAPAS